MDYNVKEENAKMKKVILKLKNENRNKISIKQLLMLIFVNLIFINFGGCWRSCPNGTCNLRINFKAGDYSNEKGFGRLSVYSISSFFYLEQ
ncbi:MAG TPA: hypothetical protein DCW42_08510 [Bacteroidetes bacterium]|nr:hypothetical protein [Bacteroidota bacterium]